VRKITEDRAAGLNIGESGSTSALYCGFLRFLAIDFSFLIFFVRFVGLVQSHDIIILFWRSVEVFTIGETAVLT